MLPYVISNKFALFTISFIFNVATAYGTNPQQLWNSSTEPSGCVLSPLSTIHTSSHYHHHLWRNFCIPPLLHGMEGHKNTNACNSRVCNERWGGQTCTCSFILGPLCCDIYLFRLCWVFVAVQGFSLAAVSMGYSLVVGWRLLFAVGSTGFRCTNLSSCGARA